MIVPKYIEEEMSFAERESQAAPALWSAALRIDESVSGSSLTRAQSAFVVDSNEACDWMLPGFEENSSESETNWKAGRVIARRLPAIRRIDRLEESLYWLISAATLLYLLFMIVTG